MYLNDVDEGIIDKILKFADVTNILVVLVLKRKYNFLGLMCFPLCSCSYMFFLYFNFLGTNIDIIWLLFRLLECVRSSFSWSYQMK